MTKLNPLEHPICFVQPGRLAAPWEWVEHVPFAMFLIDILRPSLLVELGTHSGNSYCAFCQAIQHLHINARSFAVDTWEGDAQAGFYGPEVLQELRAYHDPRYGSFSRLVQSSFDEAVKDFSDGSIDLLHVDGLHTYEAVKHDFESWLPKLSSTGVAVFHDISVRDGDFGVWKLWDEVKEQHPHFAFLHGHGLGILQVGVRITPALEPLFSLTDGEAKSIRECFSILGSRLSSMLRLAKSEEQVAERDARVQALSEQVEAIAASSTWRVGLLLRRMGGWLAPPGSRRARLLRRLLPEDGSPIPVGTQPVDEEEAVLVGQHLAATPRALRVSVILATKNAGPLFSEVLEKLAAQEYDGEIEIIVIDSGSSDDTAATAARHGAIVRSIPAEEFDHGLTRNRAIEMASGEIVVLMSQDALPGDQYLIRNLVKAFADARVAGAYARQVPRQDADVLTKRNLNGWLTGRPAKEVRWIRDWAAYDSLSPMQRYTFCNFDDVCSAIRKGVWQSVPFQATEFGEDIEWAERALEAGWKIAYWPDAYVIHSHVRSFEGEYDRTRLTHKRLRAQFGLQLVPTWRHVISSTILSMLGDWSYALWHEGQTGALLKLLVRIPFLSFASVYGQYSGAKAATVRVLHGPKGTVGGPMKIVLTTHQFMPEYSAGTEILTYETAKELQRLGHAVAVVSGFPAAVALKDEKRFDEYTHDGIRVRRFLHNYSPMGGQSNAMEMEYNNRLFKSHFMQYLRREKPDVVHFFHLARLSGSAVDACSELGIPMVFTPTDFWFVCPTSQLRLPDQRACNGPDRLALNCLRHIAYTNQPARVNRWIERLPDWLLGAFILAAKWGFKIDSRYSGMVQALAHREEFLRGRLMRIHKVAVPTRFMRSVLSQHGLEADRAIELPFGLNLAHLEHASRPEQGVGLRLGYIGTLFEHKGVHVLAQAVKALPGKPIELSIYGREDDFPEYVAGLRKIIGEDARVHFCGTFPNSEIGAILSGLDALVLPSLWHENTPLVVYSAQAAGCPVIGSDVAGIAEVIEHGTNGLLFEKGNVKQLANAIQSLLDDRQLLKRLSSHAKQPLSIQEYVSKLLEIYKGLVQIENRT